MAALRVVVVDFWWGNDDIEGAQRFLAGNRVCRGLVARGLELELVFPASAAARPDLVFFGGFGAWFDSPHRIEHYDGSVRIFSCDENLHHAPEFARHLDYARQYDYSFTYDRTTDRNFHIAGFRTADHLDRLGQGLPPSETDRLMHAKTDFACFLYSNGAEEEEGVRLRNEFFRRLSRVRHVNSGGLVMNNMDAAVAQEQTGSFVARHKFVIAMENSIHPGYVTEKILHGFLHGAVPVYCGAPDVGTLYNPAAFVHYTGDNYEEVVETMLRLDRDDQAYASMLAAPKFPQPRRPEFQPGSLDARIDRIAQALRTPARC